MEYVCLEIIPGIKIKTRRGGKCFKLYSPETGMIIRGKPTIFVDGVYISDHQKVIEMDPIKIEAISSINAPYMYGNKKMNGIISIYTKKGNCTDINLPKSAIRRMYGTINTTIEKDSHNIAKEKMNTARIPDLRTELFWKSGIKTDQRGKGKIEFITSDVKHNFRIDIQGFTTDGKFISAHEIIAVK